MLDPELCRKHIMSCSVMSQVLSVQSLSFQRGSRHRHKNQSIWIELSWPHVSTSLEWWFCGGSHHKYSQIFPNTLGWWKAIANNSTEDRPEKRNWDGNGKRRSKKNNHPQEITWIPCLPPQLPTSMLWSEVPSTINRNGWFHIEIRRQDWIGGRAKKHDVCGVVLHEMAVFFFERTRHASHV